MEAGTLVRPKGWIPVATGLDDHQEYFFIMSQWVNKKMSLKVLFDTFHSSWIYIYIYNYIYIWRFCSLLCRGLTNFVHGSIGIFGHFLPTSSTSSGFWSPKNCQDADLVSFQAALEVLRMSPLIFPNKPWDFPKVLGVEGTGTTPSSTRLEIGWFAKIKFLL